jgi:predicted DNA-binding protein
MYYNKIERRKFMVISIRMTDEEKELAAAYAKLNGVSLSEAIKRAYFEKIEDEYDIAVAEAALREYEKDHKSYSHEEVKKMFNL